MRLDVRLGAADRAVVDRAVGRDARRDLVASSARQLLDLAIGSVIGEREPVQIEVVGDRAREHDRSAVGCPRRLAIDRTGREPHWCRIEHERRDPQARLAVVAIAARLEDDGLAVGRDRRVRVADAIGRRPQQVGLAIAMRVDHDEPRAERADLRDHDRDRRRRGWRCDRARAARGGQEDRRKDSQ